jgi:hypothetical protein
MMKAASTSETFMIAGFPAVLAVIFIFHDCLNHCNSIGYDTIIALNVIDYGIMSVNDKWERVWEELVKIYLQDTISQFSTRK